MWHNVQELATPLAGASVETGVEVHITGDVADRAASGGCPASPCSVSDYAARRRGDLIHKRNPVKKKATANSIPPA